MQKNIGHIATLTSERIFHTSLNFKLVDNNFSLRYVFGEMKKQYGQRQT